MKWRIGLLMCFLVKTTIAQQYGAQWVLGYNESVLDFRNDTLVNYPISPSRGNKKGLFNVLNNPGIHLLSNSSNWFRVGCPSKNLPFSQLPTVEASTPNILPSFL